MILDYDLSNLHTDQADFWMYLKVDTILAEIVADQPARRASPLALGASARNCIMHIACEAVRSTPEHETGSRLAAVGLGNREVNWHAFTSHFPGLDCGWGSSLAGEQLRPNGTVH
jgi:hypothetical protein